MDQAVVASKGKVAILDSWLMSRKDFNGYLTSEDAKELLGQLLTIFKPDSGAARTDNLATALRIIIDNLAAMHDPACDFLNIGSAEDCMACHAFEESNAVSVLQTHDDAMVVRP